MSSDWTRIEVEAVVSNYFEMLKSELKLESYNKAEHNRHLQRLTGRSRASIEKKHENISAILLALEHPWIPGYKPLRKFQRLLAEVVTDRLSNEEPTSLLLGDIVDSSVTTAAIEDDQAVEVEAPSRKEFVYPETVSDSLPRVRRGVRVDFIAQESRNRSLGEAGERFALEFEAKRLHRLGARQFVDRIEHVSKSVGDGLGYDILSYEPDGKERLIEVKSTRFDKLTPFYVSQNELAVSTEQPDAYHLYRVFDFRKDPRLFVLRGQLDHAVHLSAVAYRAAF